MHWFRPYRDTKKLNQLLYVINLYICWFLQLYKDNCTSIQINHQCCQKTPWVGSLTSKIHDNVDGSKGPVVSWGWEWKRAWWRCVKGKLVDEGIGSIHYQHPFIYGIFNLHLVDLFGKCLGISSIHGLNGLQIHYFSFNEIYYIFWHKEKGACLSWGST